MKEALTARLQGLASGARVFWLVRPQTAPHNALPALVLALISRERPQDMEGFIDLDFARVQVTAYAATFAAAEALREAAIAALAPAQTANGQSFSRGFFTGERDDVERTSEGAIIYVASFDALLHFKAAS